MLNESVNDKAALKIVFLAGGPGTGKNHVANQLFGIQQGRSFGASGMKMVSFDTIYERLLAKRGYGTDLQNLSKEEEWELTSTGNPNSVYNQGRKIVKKQLANYMKQGIGIIFDGTGQNVSSYLDKIEDAEDFGYDAHMIYVDTPLETALKRNANRSRKLPADVVTRLHMAVKGNQKRFGEIFGDNMITVKNDDGEGVTGEIQHAVNKVLAQPVENPIGKEWLASGGSTERKLRPRHSAPPLPPADYIGAKSGKSSAMPDSWWDQFKPIPKPKPAPQGPPVTPKGQMSLFPSEKPKPKAGESPAEKYDRATKQEDPALAAFKKKQADAMANFKKKQAEKKKAESAKDNPLSQRIHNPDTGNDILVSTALGYPPDHPMRIAAEKFLKK